MIRHVVLLNWKPGTTDDQIRKVEDDLARMPDLMPTIRRYEGGRDLGVTGSHDFAIVADFDTIDDYRRYADQPDHVAITRDVIGPILESIARVQYTL